MAHPPTLDINTNTVAQPQAATAGEDGITVFIQLICAMSVIYCVTINIYKRVILYILFGSIDFLYLINII